MLLRKHRKIADNITYNSIVTGNSTFLNYLLLLCIPLVASGIYGIILVSHVIVPTLIPAFYILTPIGAIMFIVSAVKIFMAKKPLSADNTF